MLPTNSVKETSVLTTISTNRRRIRRSTDVLCPQDTQKSRHESQRLATGLQEILPS